MVRGNPDISTNSATMKAEKALNDRQSREVRGLAKLKAKIIKTKELMMTSDHNPYAGASSICTSSKKLLSWLSYDPYVAHLYLRELHALHETNARGDTAVTRHKARRLEYALCALPKGKTERSRQILETQDPSATLTIRRNPLGL